MIIFGQAKDVAIEDTRKPKHLTVKKFVPIFEREGEVYSKLPGEKYATFHIGKRYLAEFWWDGANRSKVPTVWRVWHLRRARAGQLKLL